MKSPIQEQLVSLPMIEIIPNSNHNATPWIGSQRETMDLRAIPIIIVGTRSSQI